MLHPLAFFFDLLDFVSALCLSCVLPGFPPPLCFSSRRSFHYSILLFPSSRFHSSPLCPPLLLLLALSLLLFLCLFSSPFISLHPYTVFKSGPFRFFPIPPTALPFGPVCSRHILSNAATSMGRSFIHVSILPSLSLSLSPLSFFFFFLLSSFLFLLRSGGRV